MSKRHKPQPNQMQMFPEELTPVVSQLANQSSSSEPHQPIQEHATLTASRSKTTITKPGDLWTIGKHRLLCGDSSNSDHVTRLLNGHKVQLVHSDPPYNVKVQPQSKDLDSAKARKLDGDFISDAKFRQLLYYWFLYLARSLEPGRAFYIWGGYSNIVNYPPLIKAAGLYYSQAIIWVKSMSVFTRKDFMGQHEICFYGWKDGANHQFHGPNNVTDVWEVQNLPRSAMIHLTEKPVEIPLRAIKCSSVPGEIVLDFFGGSGSTLIAADQLDRVCYLMEIDPWYCDVIVERCKGLNLPIKRFQCAK